MSCVSRFSKYILLFFNVVILVSAALLLAYGIIYLNKTDGLGNLFSLGGLAIGVGVVTFLIAFLGCCGAFRESSCLLTTYAIILICVLVAQIVLAVLAFVKIQDEGSFDNEIVNLVQKIFDDSSDSAQKSFQNMQKDMKCCGVRGFTDYSNGPPYPKSCCAKEADPCYQPYETGCAIKIADVVEDNIIILGSIAIAFAVIEFFGAAFAFMVRKRRGEYV